MANTYTQLYVQFVFAVQNRGSLIQSAWKDELRKFNWQEGYGAFSYSHSHIDRVIKYILNQQEHHKKKSFQEEYQELLDKFNIEYDSRYLLKDIH